MSVNFVQNIDDWLPVRNALISVSDKQKLEVLVNGLVSLNDSVKIYSTGGTFARIGELLGPEAAARHLVAVSDYTGQPETQGGLVKTLDFKIYLGLLTETYNEAHQQDLQRTSAVAIDLVAVNLYPFAETVAKPDVTVELARANIDIGGPCMIRASAKNYLRVASVTNPSDYAAIIKKMKLSGGRLDLKSRFDLARKAFAHTAAYDSHIAEYLQAQSDAQMESCYTKKGA